MESNTIDLRRAGAAFFVVLLHVLLILAFLRATVHKIKNPPAAREFVITIIAPHAPAKPQSAPPPPAMIVPSAPRPNQIGPFAVPAPNGAALRGLHQSLFNCAPEVLGDLTPQQRARCASQAMASNPDDTLALSDLPSQARDPEHWERALVRKQNPLLAPCVRPEGPPPRLLLVLCLSEGALNGFGDPDETRGYGDAPLMKPHIPNNGDPTLEPLHH